MKKNNFGNKGNVRWKSLTSQDRAWKMSRGYKWLTDDKPLWYTNTGLREQKRLMNQSLV